ncbi:NADH-quinone oxidoreductase subunit A [soil metagenome]
MPIPAFGFDGAPPIPILAAVGSTTEIEDMTPYFEDYLTVGAFAGLGVVLVLVMLGVASVLRPSNPTKEKLGTYECGVDPVGVGWSQSYVRYYIFGLLFVIFGVEAVFIFPWALEVEALGVFGLVAMLLFMLTLVEGLFYAIKKGVLRWE